MRADAFNRDYSDKIGTAIWNAIKQESLVAATGAIVMRNHEVVSALTEVLATVAATSAITDTPAKLRKFSDDIAEDLVRRIQSARDEWREH